MTSHPFTHGETGNRIVCFGFFLRVTGDGHQKSAFRESAVRPSAAGSRFPRPIAEKPTPELPTPVAVTRHLKTKAPANHPVSGFRLSLWQSILGSQVSALRPQVRVIRCRCGCGKIQVLNLYPNLST